MRRRVVHRRLLAARDWNRRKGACRLDGFSRKSRRDLRQPGRGCPDVYAVIGTTRARMLNPRTRSLTTVANFAVPAKGADVPALRVTHGRMAQGEPALRWNDGCRFGRSPLAQAR